MGDVQQAKIFDAYVSASNRVRGPLLALLNRLWSQLSGYRPADAEAFAELVVPIVQGAMRQSAALTSAYLASSLSDLLGKPVAPSAIDTAALDRIRGVDPHEVYARPFNEVRYQLGQSVPLDEAIRRGSQRLESLATTDVQLARTHTSQQVLANQSQVAGYRRVLTGGKSCGLCVIASTQRYHKKDLLPVHPGCGCAVQPLAGSASEQVVDPETLSSAHEAIAERFGYYDSTGRERLDYRKVILVEEHGELGPVLTVAHHSHRGPSDIPS